MPSSEAKGPYIYTYHHQGDDAASISSTISSITDYESRQPIAPKNEKGLESSPHFVREFMDGDNHLVSDYLLEVMKGYDDEEEIVFEASRGSPPPYKFNDPMHPDYHEENGPFHSASLGNSKAQTCDGVFIPAEEKFSDVKLGEDANEDSTEVIQQHENSSSRIQRVIKSILLQYAATDGQYKNMMGGAGKKGRQNPTWKLPKEESSNTQQLPPEQGRRDDRTWLLLITAILFLFAAGACGAVLLFGLTDEETPTTTNEAPEIGSGDTSEVNNDAKLQYIREVAGSFSGLDTIDNTSTPQYQAIQWLVEKDSFDYYGSEGRFETFAERERRICLF